VPGFGDAAKGVFKGGRKAVTEISQAALRNADELGQAALRSADNTGTEIVQRWMSRAELENTYSTGLLRGGREGTHHVTDFANSNAKRARQRLSLGQTPEIRATLEVPAGKFGPPTKVDPLNKMPGGGLERKAIGDIPVRILDTD